MPIANSHRYQLVNTCQKLVLTDTVDTHVNPVFVDFTAGSNLHRLKFGGGKGQRLAKAIGLHKFKSPHVADLTAGLGRDAFVMATLGCQVTLVERHPMIHALLKDGLQRAAQSQDEQIKEIIPRMQLLHIDGSTWLNTLSKEQAPEVIYLDPMFPERSKTSLVKKEMRFFHELIGNDADAKDLLALARNIAKRRIVVKRPRKSPTLSSQKPDFVIEGKTTRFDVYLPSNSR